jgi:hypothetical protein
MDARSSQETPQTAPPRHLYFGAEDRRVAGRSELTDQQLLIERSRRQAAHQRAIAKAHHLISALKSVYAFDQTGNVMLAVPHVADSLEDAIRAARAFLGDVNAASERFDSAAAELARLEAIPVGPARVAAAAAMPRGNR